VTYDQLFLAAALGVFLVTFVATIGECTGLSDHEAYCARTRRYLPKIKRGVQ
jgi:hypothetical protein